MFDLIEHTADPRAIAVLQKPDVLYAELQGVCRTLLRGTRERMQAWETATVPDEELAAIDRKLQPLEERVLDRDARREQLERAVVDAPDDKGARLVYADFLLEESDPRGTFITLQCGPQTRETRSTCKQLLTEHEATWLGELGAVIPKKGRKWRQGFLEVCDAVFKHPGQLEDLLSHPAWRTIRDLEVRINTTFQPSELPWVQLLPVLPGLRRMRGIKTGAKLTEVLFSGGPWPVTHLQVAALAPRWTWPWETDRFPQQLGEWAFPHLQELHLPQLAAVAVPWWLERGARFERLRFSMDPDGRLKRHERQPDTPDRAAWVLERLEGLPLQNTVIETSDLTLERSGERLVARVRRDTADVRRVLDGLPSHEVV